MNRNLVLVAVVTGILCGAWAGVAPLVNLFIWGRPNAPLTGCGRGPVVGIVLP